MRTRTPLLAVAAAATILASCGGTSTTTTEPAPATEATATTTTTLAVSPTDAFLERMAAIDAAVAEWREADSIETAHEAAETAANLVVGPNGPGYGDRSGDGAINGETTVGVLAGLDGTPSGLATHLPTNECVTRDVLGGTWEDPGAEWDAMLSAIDAWRPDNNTMPTLGSHPMRIVGWATFTLGSDSLEEAHEYAGHAKLHVDVALRALDC